MTTRHAGYLVTLAEDRREDDDEAIRTALRMVAGVVNVQPIPATIETAMAEARRDRAWRSMLYELASRGPREATS